MSHRPELHVTAEEGILVAPAGVLLHDDVWHVFNQYQPTVHDGARWGHQASHGVPYDWDVCDDVLAPYGDEVDVRAGAVIQVGRGLDMFFTAVTEESTAIKVAEVADADATTETVSDDIHGLDAHVDHIRTVLSDSEGFHRFRSPCVVPDWRTDDREAHQGWVMLTVTGSSDSPTILVHESTDRRSWSLIGPLTFQGDSSGIENYSRVVAPRLVRLFDEVDSTIYDVLLLTVEVDSKEVSGYLVGTLNDAEFTVLTPFTRLDYGHDFSRPRNTNVIAPAQATPAERYASGTMFGLMNGKGRSDKPDNHLSFREEKWANCLTLPRRITLEGGKLYQAPHEGLVDAIRASEHARGIIVWADEFTSDSDAIHLELIDAHERVAARITYAPDRIMLDRSMNPHHAGDAAALAERAADESETLSVIVDGSTVEVFADGGLIAMASRVCFDGGYRGVRYSTDGEAQVGSTLEINPV